MKANLRKGSILLLACVLLLGLLVVGCAKPAAETPAADTQTADAAPAALPGEGETYAVILSLHQLEFFDALKAGVYDATQEIGATWYFAGPQEFVPDQIAQAIDQAVASGVTGIVLHGQSEDTADAVKNAMDAGVPVVVVDTDIGTDRLAFIGTNPAPLGQEMARELAEQIGGKGEVIMSTFMNQPSAIIMLEAAKETLAAEYPDVKVVSEIDDMADSGVAASKIGAALQANPNVVGILGMQAPTGVGAATAVREAGLTGKVKIVCRDRDISTLELVEKGEIATTFVQTSYAQGYIAIQWLHEYVNGNYKVVNGYLDAGINPVPDHAEARMIKVTQDNYKLFLEPYKYEVTAKVG
ncbi:MAG: substrate-binding domain-containing protein [Synergistes sp.]|nr:substrate-binding domain-containing protein [Synergistes sp.]